MAGPKESIIKRFHRIGESWYLFFFIGCKLCHKGKKQPTRYKPSIPVTAMLFYPPLELQQHCVLCQCIAPDVLRYIDICDTPTSSKLNGRSEWGMYERGHYCQCNYRSFKFTYSKQTSAAFLDTFTLIPSEKNILCNCYTLSFWGAEGIHKTARKVRITYTLEAMVQLTCIIVHR